MNRWQTLTLWDNSKVAIDLEVVEGVVDRDDSTNIFTAHNVFGVKEPFKEVMAMLCSYRGDQ